MKPSAPSPFSSAAPSLFAAGMCPIPCGGESGKEPLIATSKWHKSPGAETISAMARDPRFQNANVGVLTGLSGVTVVDIDAPSQINAVVELFGQTPLKTRTPRGGVHLWYAAGGEHNRNLRRFDLNVDIKGVGGFVVVPPSVLPGQKTYLLEEGDWCLRASLPGISLRGQDFLRRTAANTTPNEKRRSVARIGIGHRNDYLFREALRLAHGMASEGELVEELSQVNIISCDPLLGDGEVVKTPLGDVDKRDSQIA